MTERPPTGQDDAVAMSAAELGRLEKKLRAYANARGQLDSVDGNKAANALAELSRRRAREANRTWRCYHCDFVAKTPEEATAHFGATCLAVSGCVLSAEQGGLLAEVRRLELAFDEALVRLNAARNGVDEQECLERFRATRAETGPQAERTWRPEEVREELDTVLSRAMDLLDDMIGPLDKQIDEQRRGDYDLPEDAEFNVVVTAGQNRKLSEAWHLLSGRLAAIRALPLTEPQSLPSTVRLDPGDEEAVRDAIAQLNCGGFKNQARAIIIQRLLDAAKTEPQSPWRPISEAPKDARAVWLAGEHANMVIGFWVNDRWADFYKAMHTNGRTDVLFTPTYWAPLPSPPADGGR